MPYFQLLGYLLMATLIVVVIRTSERLDSRASLKSQAHQGTSLFTSAATNQKGIPKGISW